MSLFLQIFWVFLTNTFEKKSSPNPQIQQTHLGIHLFIIHHFRYIYLKWQNYTQYGITVICIIIFLNSATDARFQKPAQGSLLTSKFLLFLHSYDSSNSPFHTVSCSWIVCCVLLPFSSPLPHTYYGFSDSNCWFSHPKYKALVPR